MSSGRAFHDDLARPPGTNPEAGTHAVSTDERELRAGREAAAQSWDECPYYEARFGERGRLFCDSDTSWLITRCDAGRGNALRDIRWLGGVLSSRGIPQILLERHLANKITIE